MPAIAAMKKGKHVLVHKPLANRLEEARMVIETARKTKVGTKCLFYLGLTPPKVVRAKK